MLDPQIRRAIRLWVSIRTRNTEGTGLVPAFPFIQDESAGAEKIPAWAAEKRIRHELSDRLVVDGFER